MPLPPLFERNFPTYVVDRSVKDVHVYWYHPDFTQSRYPPAQESKLLYYNLIFN